MERTRQTAKDCRLPCRTKKSDSLSFYYSLRSVCFRPTAAASSAAEIGNIRRRRSRRADCRRRKRRASSARRSKRRRSESWNWSCCRAASRAWCCTSNASTRSSRRTMSTAAYACCAPCSASAREDCGPRRSTADSTAECLSAEIFKR